jgi:hypothetical protein
VLRLLDPERPQGYIRSMGVWWVRLGLAIALTLATTTGGCGLDKPKPAPPAADEDARVDADLLGDSFENTSDHDFLSPDEREAMRRVGATDEPEVAGPIREEPKSAFGRFSEEVGKAMIAILGVGVTVGMAIAPFLLF